MTDDVYSRIEKDWSSAGADAGYKATELQLQVLLDHVSDLIVRQRADGTLLYLSPASSDLLGYVPEQLVGSELYALIHVEDREAARRKISAARHRGGVVTTTCRVQHADGSHRWMEINSRLIDHDGAASEVVSVLRDIQARKRGEELAVESRQRLECAVSRKTRQIGLAFDLLKRKAEANARGRAALAMAERRYTMLVENTLTGIYTCEGNRLTFCNERFARIFGYRRAEMKGMDLSALGVMHADGELAPLMGQEEVIAMHTREGMEKWLKLSRACCEHDRNGYVLGNVIDITEQVDIHERLKASEHALHMLSEQLIVAQENERKRIANDLHDGLGQRLSAIKFSVEDVLRCEMEGGRTTQAERLRAIVERIRGTIEEIRRVSMDLRPSTLDDLGLIATLGWFCREFGQVYQGIVIDRETTVNEAMIPQRLKVDIFRITQEAMHNIAKHAAATQATIRLRQDGGRLSLVIQDNGAGFDYTHAAALGTGLGLKTMRERAELTGGRFTVESRPQGGTAISVDWPDMAMVARALGESEIPG